MTVVSFFLKKCLVFFKFHLIAFVVAIVVGVLSFLPQYLSIKALGSDYHGVPYLYQDAAMEYLTRIHEFVDGNSTVASPFLYEYKNGRSVMPPTGENVYWILAKVTGLSIFTVVAWSTFFFPAILFFLVYAFSFLLISQINGRRLLAITTGLAVTLGYGLVDLPSVFSIFLNSYQSTFLSIWSRLVNPVTGAIFLFGFFISILLLVRGKFIAWVPATLFLAVMTGYIFSFGIGLMFAFVFLIVALFFREFKIARLFGFIICGSLLINIPHLIFILPTIFSSSAAESLKSGLLLTHAFLPSKVLIITLVVVGSGLVLDYFRKRTISIGSPQLFCFLILLSSFFVMNQQVITGKTIWPQHFVQYTIPFSLVALLVFSFIYIQPFLPRLWKIFSFGVILFSFLLNVFALPTYVNKLSDYRRINQYADFFQWVDSTVGPCVVLDVGVISNSSITAFTHCDSYMTHYTFVGIPKERIMHNFLVFLVFQGVSSEKVEEYLFQHEDLVRAIFFRDWKDLFRHSSDPWLSSISDRKEIDRWVGEVIKDISAQYADFYRRDFRTELLRYRLDYIVWYKKVNNSFNIDNFSFLEKINEINDVVIYRIK